MKARLSSSSRAAENAVPLEATADNKFKIDPAVFFEFNPEKGEPKLTRAGTARPACESLGCFLHGSSTQKVSMNRFVFAGRLLALPLALTLTACADGVESTQRGPSK